MYSPLINSLFVFKSPQFAAVETVVTAIVDCLPNKWKFHKRLILLAYCTFGFFMCFICTTQVSNFLHDRFVWFPFNHHGIYSSRINKVERFPGQDDERCVVLVFAWVRVGVNVNVCEGGGLYVVPLCEPDIWHVCFLCFKYARIV